MIVVLQDYENNYEMLLMRRGLESTRDPRASSSTDGTIAILIVVTILFCCVWYVAFPNN